MAPAITSTLGLPNRSKWFGARKPAGYALFDVYAEWQMAEHASLNVWVQDVFDRRYFTAGAAGYDASESNAVARANPIEL